MGVRAVIDTGVMLSAILFGGKPKECLYLAQSGRFEALTCQGILAELEAKLLTKFGLSEQDAGRHILAATTYLEVVEVSGQLVGACADPKDDMVIECAVIGRADYIVSGDRKHLLSLGSYEAISIVDPATLLAIIGSEDAI